MLSNIKIAQSVKLKPISAVSASVGILKDELELCGKYKANLAADLVKRLKKAYDGRLILVTAINPILAACGTDILQNDKITGLF